MQIVFEDTDLEELITTGRNNKYKKYTRNSKFMKALAIATTICGYLSVPVTSVPSLSSTTSNLQEPME